MVNGFAHIALYSDHFDESVAFYERAFGARLLGSFVVDTRGCWLDINGDILEIFEGGTEHDGHFGHFAIACDSVDELYEKALACGAEPHTAPKDISLALEEPLDARIAFVKGPDGEQIELFEVK